MSYSVSPELYRETAVRLADTLDGGGYFSGSVRFAFGGMECRLTASVIVCRRREYPRTARVRGRARGVPRRSHRAHHGQHPRHGLHGLLGAGVAAEPYGKKTPGALRKSSGRLHAGGGGSGRRDAGKPPPSVYRPSSAPSVSQSMERRVKRISKPESQSPTSVSRPIPPSASRVSEE